MIDIGNVHSVEVDAGGSVWARLAVVGEPSGIWIDRFQAMAPDGIQLLNLEGDLLFNLHAHPSAYPVVLEQLRQAVHDANLTTFNLDDPTAIVNAHVTRWRQKR